LHNGFSKAKNRLPTLYLLKRYCRKSADSSYSATPTLRTPPSSPLSTSYSRYQQVTLGKDITLIINTEFDMNVVKRYEIVRIFDLSQNGPIETKYAKLDYNIT